MPPRPSGSAARIITSVALLVLLSVAPACGADEAMRVDGPSTTTPVTASQRPTDVSVPRSAPSTTGAAKPSTKPSTTAAPTSAPTTTAAASSGRRLAGLTVVIDPGHNGRNGSDSKAINRPVDAGGFMKPCNTTGTAGGDGYTEAEFNWETALVVVDAVKAAGGTPVLTRTSNDGVGPCVDERGLTSAKVGADVLVSIHADGSTGASNRGFHVIHAASLRGYTDTTAADSGRLAVLVRDRLVAAGWSPSNYIGKAGLDERGDLGTLNRSSVPSVMIESGNMRNAADLSRLESASAKSSMAAAIVDALADFRSGPGQ